MILCSGFSLRFHFENFTPGNRDILSSGIYFKFYISETKKVNVGRAGAASLNIRQDIEYVADEAKVVTVLSMLQKTPPPVLVFAERKKAVDRVHEYLLLKGVECVAIHGGKDQEDRMSACANFRAGDKDVLGKILQTLSNNPTLY